MPQHNYLNHFVNELANKYTVFFDVYRDEWLDDIPLSFIAQYRRRDERYMFTKKMKIYGVENQQLVFTTTSSNKVTLDALDNFHKSIESNLHEYTIKHQEHMSTVVIGLIVTDAPINYSVAKEVERYRKLKFLKFGLHGWAELYLAIVQPNEKDIIVHPKGKPFVLSIEKLLLEEMA